jgi:hypothetical protein
VHSHLGPGAGASEVGSGVRDEVPPCQGRYDRATGLSRGFTHAVKGRLTIAVRDQCLQCSPPLGFNVIDSARNGYQ